MIGTPKPGPGSKAKLRAAYEATDYRVEIAGSTVTIRIGKPLPAAVEDLLATNATRVAAYLTAFNPVNGTAGPIDNPRRQAHLLRALALEGVPVVHGDGAIADASWPAERSVLAIGIGRGEALELAERFGQNAYVEVVAGERARLVFTRHWGA